MDVVYRRPARAGLDAVLRSDGVLSRPQPPTNGRSLSNDLRPAHNKAVGGQCAPGSTFKMMTALAGLRAGVSPNDHVYCSGVTVLGSARFHCWNAKANGSLDMTNALKFSCDLHFY